MAQGSGLRCSGRQYSRMGEGENGKRGEWESGRFYIHSLNWGVAVNLRNRIVYESNCLQQISNNIHLGGVLKKSKSINRRGRKDFTQMPIAIGTQRVEIMCFSFVFFAPS